MAMTTMACVLRGYGSILRVLPEVVGPHYLQHRFYKQRYKSTEEALRQDWEIVASDLRKAVEQHAEELKSVERKP
jgi:hypothetical protein